MSSDPREASTHVDPKQAKGITTRLTYFLRYRNNARQENLDLDFDDGWIEIDTLLQGIIYGVSRNQLVHVLFNDSHRFELRRLPLNGPINHVRVTGPITDGQPHTSRPSRPVLDPPEEVQVVPKRRQGQAIIM